MARAAPVAEAPAVEMIPLDQITEAEFNPRKVFRGIEELAADLKIRGLLQPVLVRPNSGAYQLIFGARRYRAAKLAGLLSVPAMIRVMDDAEALEAAIVENDKRSDVHPLEEADGYRELMAKHRYTADRIAEKIGKSKAYVYGRLKLCELCPEVREAFLEDKLPPSTALELARIPHLELQVEAFKRVTQPTWAGEGMSVRQAQREIRERYTLDLNRAPFDVKDAALTSAGACTTCPKRTGSNPDLFGDFAGKNTCTDLKCHAEKVKASADRKIAEAREKGRAVLEGKEAEKALVYGGGYVDLNDECFEDPKRRTYGELLKKAKDLTPAVVVDTRHGEVREVAPAKDVKEALKAAGHDALARKLHVPGDRDQDAKAQQREKEQRALRERVCKRAGELIQEKAAKKTPDVKFWRALANLLTADMHLELVPDETVERIPKMDEPQLRALVILAALDGVGAFSVWGSKHSETLRTACELYGIDLDKLDAEEKEAAKAAKAEAKKPKKKGLACEAFTQIGTLAVKCELEPDHPGKHKSGIRAWGDTKKPKKAASTTRPPPKQTDLEDLDPGEEAPF